MNSDRKFVPLQPLSFFQQHLYPALACLALAFTPYAMLRAITAIFPAIFRAHRHLHSISFFAVHSWGFFMLIVAGLIIYLGLGVDRSKRSILNPSPKPTL